MVIRNPTAVQRLFLAGDGSMGITRSRSEFSTKSGRSECSPFPRQLPRLMVGNLGTLNMRKLHARLAQFMHPFGSIQCYRLPRFLRLGV